MATRGLIPWWRSERGLAERDPFASLHKEMNELLEGFLGSRTEGGGNGFWPRVDVIENEKAVTVTAELPGIDEKDIEVSVADGMLMIRGEKRQEKEEKGEERYHLERAYGAFRRELPLPCAVDVDKATATFSKGVLAVTLPKTPEAAKSTKIKLSAA